jgi:hypothetical protein
LRQEGEEDLAGEAEEPRWGRELLSDVIRAAAEAACEQKLGHQQER